MRLSANAKEKNKPVSSAAIDDFAVLKSDLIISKPFQIPPALPYTWGQQLQDVDIVVPVPKGSRARDLTVTIAKKKLSVGLKNQEPIMAGELCQDIKVEDSTWTLGEG